MASLQRTSGAAGEGDFIDPNTNDAIGGTAGDTMHGGSGRNVFTGGGGNDTLRGNAGPDQLVGGATSTACSAVPTTTCSTGDTVEDKIMDCNSGTSDVLFSDLRDLRRSAADRQQRRRAQARAEGHLRRGRRGRQGAGELDAPEELEAAPLGDAAPA